MDRSEMGVRGRRVYGVRTRVEVWKPAQYGDGFSGGENDTVT